MHWVGNGFPVRSVFDYNGLGRELDPFLMLDYAASHEFEPGSEKRGVEAHPHKGFETVTIVFDGELEHRDSTGAGGKIGPGDVQWMTAGKGIIHEEFHSESFVRQGGGLHMLQLWVNLPAKDKSASPGYQSLLSTDIPTVTLADGMATARVIAGQMEGVSGPAKTFTPVQVWDVVAQNGAKIQLPLPDGQVATTLILSGRIQLGDEQAAAGDLIQWSIEGAGADFEAMEQTHMVVLAGEPIGEPVVGYGPFVMNSHDEIRDAVRQYQAGAMGRLD